MTTAADATPTAIGRIGSFLGDCDEWGAFDALAAPTLEAPPLKRRAAAAAELGAVGLLGAALRTEHRNLPFDTIRSAHHDHLGR